MVLESLFPTPMGGGAETQVRRLGQRLCQIGFDVVVIVPMVAYGQQDEEDRVDGMEVVRIRYPKIRVIGTVIMLFRLAMLLVMRHREYAAIHAHIAHNMAAVCCVMGRLLRKPVVVKLTGMHEMTRGILAPHPGLSGALQRLALTHATYFQATSSQIQHKLVQCGFTITKVRAIPNAVDTDVFNPCHHDLRLRRELCHGATIVAIFVGRLAAEKGLEQLLHCWSRAFNRSQPARLLLVGDGSLKVSLCQLISTLGIEDQVILLGHSDRVEHYLAASDFAILPSLNEGLSNALLEYMASGLPVLGSRISGTEDLVVPGETGWLFTAGNERELETCLAEVSETPLDTIHSMGRKARQRIMHYASIDTVIRQLTPLYGVKQEIAN